MHCLALAIARKTLDDNRFRNAQKTTDCPAPNFQVEDGVYFKNKQPSKSDLKWRAGCRVVHIEHDGHYLYIENQATGKTQSCNVKDVMHEPLVEPWNVGTQFGRVGKFMNHPANLLTVMLNDTLKKKPYLKPTPDLSLYPNRT